MIVNFDLQKVLHLYKTDQLDKEIVNPDGERYVNQWVAFIIELMRIRGASPTRINFGYVDRTATVPSIVKTHIPTDQLIPSGQPASFDYLDICLQRAQQLLDTNKHINVLWSGGLDSTVALFSFLRQAKHLDQLSIICTFESILESGKLFDSTIRNSGVRIKFDQTRNECNLPYSYDSEDLDQLYINGQCGDQLFGPARSMHQSGVGPDDHWSKGFSKSFLDIIEPSIKFSPRPINTVRDMRWWLFFNHTWTTVLYDDCIERPAHVARRIRAFYATPEFQRWSMHTPSYYERTDQYRWPAKQALSQLIDYPYYIQHKKKSLSYTWNKNINWCMLDKNFKTYYVDK